MQPLRSMLEHREGLTRFVEHPQIAMDNNTAELAHRCAVIARKLSFGSDSLDGARLTAVMVQRARHRGEQRSGRAALADRLAQCLRRKRPLTARRPATVAAMDDERTETTRLHQGALSGAVECRYYGRDFTVAEMTLLRTLIAADPRRLVQGVLPAHRLAQARRRPQGHDGEGRHARHAPGRTHRPAGADRQAGPAQADRLRAPDRTSTVPAADPPRRGAPARYPYRGALHPRGGAVERVHRPIPLPGLHPVGRGTDAIHHP